MKTLAWLLLLVSSAIAQYNVPSFGGPYMPSRQALFMPPGAFTHSENLFVQDSSRVQRRGLTQALAASLGSAPILAMESFWHEGDSLVVVFFQGGNWYYSSYAKVTYGKSNWYEGGAYSNPSYDADYTLTTPRLIRPFARGTVDLIESLDSLEADDANSSVFVRYTAPGDTVWIDHNSSGDATLMIGTVRNVVHNGRMLLDTLIDISTLTNRLYKLGRTFSATAIPDIEIFDRRAYVTNGVDPMQVIQWYDSVLIIKEVSQAEIVPINDVQMWFYDSLNLWVSPDRGYAPDPATLDTVVTRYMRLYSWGKAWQFGEWSGGLEVGPTDLYFFRFGSNSGPTTGKQDLIRICPIFFNDENSLVLLDPLLGWADTLIKDIAVFDNYYPFRNNTQTDTTSLHLSLQNNLNKQVGSILSMAGNLEVVLSSSVTGAIKSLANSSLWVSEDADVYGLVPAGEAGLNDYIYFIHNLTPEQTKTKTVATNETYTYKVFNGGQLPSPFPDGWGIVSWYTYGGTMGKKETKITPIPRDEWTRRTFGNDQDVITVRVPSIDTTEIAISTREYYHVRYAIRGTGGPTDSLIFITSNQPTEVGSAGSGIDTNTITRWELMRAEVPRFSGLEAHNRIGLVGFGDTTDLGLVSRSSLTNRGAEPENWSPAHDVKITDEHDPVTAVESYNDFEAVFTTNQIFSAQLTSSGFWTYSELSKNLGCIAPRSVVVWNNDIYFRGRGGYYRMTRRDLNGFDFKLVSDQVKSVLEPVNLSSTYGHSGVHLHENQARTALEIAMWSERDRRIWLFFAEGTSNYPNYALTFDPFTLAWDGVQTLGAASATTVLLRDTVNMLLADPTRGMLAWGNVGVADTGTKITSALEGTIYAPFGDTIRARSERMVLTYTTEANATPGTDSVGWSMFSLSGQEFAVGADTTWKSPTGSVGAYILVDRFYLSDVGSAVNWRWRLEHKGDTINTLRRFTPLRMSVSFKPDGTGD